MFRLLFCTAGLYFLFAPGALPRFGLADPPRPVPFWDWDTSAIIVLALEVQSGVLGEQRGLDFRSPFSKVLPNGSAIKVEHRRPVKAEPLTTVVKREPGISSYGRCEDDAILIVSSGGEGNFT